MFIVDAFGLFAGAVALGFIHGVEPGHGWPVAASYALDRSNKWVAGLAAGLVLGVGHLVSSIAMVAVFFLATNYFDLTQVNDPVHLFGVQLGGPVSIVAGVVLIALGIREYTGHGHSHGNGGHSHDGHEHGHGHDGHEHGHGHDRHEHGHGHDRHEHGHGHDRHEHGHSHTDADVNDRVREHLGETPLDRPGTENTQIQPHDGTHDHAHSHSHGSMAAATDRGILGLAWFAFLLGFAHEEEFEIIALCAGSNFCLELMTAYAMTVIVGIVGLTLLLVAGYEHFEEEVGRYVPYLPTVSAVILVGMGFGFVVGLF